MRVTNSLFYTNATNNYQRNMQELYKTNQQISSGLKIQNSFEDSSVYVDTMRLNYEVSTLEQVKESTSKAQTYADNTDQVLNQFTDALTQFKTKLIQAANESNSSTSLNALGNELEALRDHMISLGNTSINGQYLFSGTDVTTKPFNDDGTYNGNNGDIEAIIGSGVKLPYNLNGESLFLGSDSEYNKTLSTNVRMLNQIELNPSSGTAKEIYIDENSTIRELVGDPDEDSSNNGNAVFYLSGRKSNGDTFSTSFSISQSSKMGDLTQRIGQEYGNTSTNKVVDVSINNHGQIEIKDLKGGNSLLEMNIFGAVDRNATGGTDGNASQSDIDTLLANPNVDIIEFNKSNFLNTNTVSSISSNQDIYNPGVFKVGAPMTFSDGTSVESTTTLQSFMGDEVNQIEFSGTDNLGNSILPIPPNDVLKIDSTTTVDDLLSTIETIYGVPARLEKGQIYLEGDESLDFAANQLEVNISALKGAGEGEVQSFSINTDATSDGDITIGGVVIGILNGDTASDIATKIAAQEASFIADNPNIASVRVDGTDVVFDYLVSAGDVANLTIASNTTGATLGAVSVEETYVEPGIAEIQSFDIKSNNSTGGPNVITIAGQNITVNDSDTPSDIASNIQTALGAVASIDSVSTSGGKVTVTYALSAGDVANTFLTSTSLTGLNIGDIITEENFSPASPVDVFSTFDSMNYERRGFEKDGNTISGNVSQIVISTNEYATDKTKLSEVSGVSLDGEQLIIEGVSSQYPYDKFSAQIDFNNPATTYSINGGENNFTIFNATGGATSANDMTYQQLNDVISMIASGEVYPDIDEDEFDAAGNNLGPSGTLFDEYNDAIKSAKSKVEVGLNYKGQLEIVDRKNSESKIEFSMFDSNADNSSVASALSFMANDAITIEEPTLDFFKNLDEMIEAVRTGTYNIDGDSDNPRNIGIQNSIAKIDHILDHVTKEHTKIGSYSNALSKANERSELLSINIQTVRSEVIDVDIAEAYMKFNQLSNSYQAMLSTVAKINSMTLLNYM